MDSYFINENGILSKGKFIAQETYNNIFDFNIIERSKIDNE